MADPKTTAPKLKNEAEIDTTLVRQLADILNDTSLNQRVSSASKPIASKSCFIGITLRPNCDATH